MYRILSNCNLERSGESEVTLGPFRDLVSHTDFGFLFLCNSMKSGESVVTLGPFRDLTSPTDIGFLFLTFSFY